MLDIGVKLLDGRIRSIIAEGHSGFAEQGGDIVCAAVSSLMQALWIGLEDVLEVEDLTIVSDPEIPLMSLSWQDDGESQALARTIQLALISIASEYPDHVTIDETQGG